MKNQFSTFMTKIYSTRTGSIFANAIVALITSFILYSVFSKKEKYVDDYVNYGNVGSMTDLHLAVNPNRRVSDYFDTCSPENFGSCTTGTDGRDPYPLP